MALPPPLGLPPLLLLGGGLPGGLGLLSPGGDGLLLGGGGVDGVDGVDGDCVGQLALASITDPSGHVLVVGDVGGGVNVCVHDGSFGFVLQSTGGGVPVVQLFTHVDPFPPDGFDIADDIFAVIFVPGGFDVTDVVLVGGHAPVPL